MADDHWMEKAVSHPGALHRALGVAAGKRIPAAKIAEAMRAKNPRIRKMASLAQTFAKARP